MCRYILITCISLFVCFANAQTNNWQGPTSGPKAQLNKSILFISQDSNNGGISTLYRHFQVATKHLGWQLLHKNGANDLGFIRRNIRASINDFDAVVLGGISLSSVTEEVAFAAQKGVAIIGWHALAEPGSTDNLFVNIGTYSEDVADSAVGYIVKHSQHPAGVLILNDERFAVANAKTKKMASLIQKSQHSTLLDVVNLNLGSVKGHLGDVFNQLNEKYGQRWTHTLAINDSYFTSSNYLLKLIDRTDIQNISAGDGSFEAFSRIKSQNSQQVATVAEPFVVQGWQLADELNRAFAKQVPSGFVAKPILVTKESLNCDNTLKNIIEYSEYQKHYLNIWFKIEVENY